MGSSENVYRLQLYLCENFTLMCVVVTTLGRGSWNKERSLWQRTVDLKMRTNPASRNPPPIGRRRCGFIEISLFIAPSENEHSPPNPPHQDLSYRAALFEEEDDPHLALPPNETVVGAST